MPEADGTVLGFDFGSKRIGVAVGNELTRTASPLEIVANHGGRPDWPRIGRLIEEWQPARLVVGMPLNMDNSEQEMSLAASRFSRQLTGRYQLPVVMVDERLSSREASSRLVDVNPRHSQSGLDPVAAQIILETWFSESDKTDEH